ncbi:MAG TPA: hypothetical protein DCS93_25865 [Microscillaceae bacterium]|nr:hypothetical protein [Microscillaceae bacterium]
MKIRRRKFLIGVLNVSLATGAFLIILLLFFNYLFLPTKVRQPLKMPNLLGSQVDTLQKFLDKYDLTYKISYEVDNWKLQKPAGTVLTQIPKSGKEIKEGREVIITITTKKPKTGVKMPRLVDTRFDDAVAQLKSLGLDTGKITYRPHLGENVVILQSHQGDTLKPGTLLPLGKKIDLMVGTGLGEVPFEMPNLVGLTLKAARKRLDELELWPSQVVYVYKPEKQAGIVMRQHPKMFANKPGKKTKIRAGEMVDLWVVGDYQ